MLIFQAALDLAPDLEVEECLEVVETVLLMVPLAESGWKMALAVLLPEPLVGVAGLAAAKAVEMMESLAAAGLAEEADRLMEPKEATRSSILSAKQSHGDNVPAPAR